jgi:hypothetical protein
LLQDPRLRVLLVGCCSQGSVAVWDVQLQQQIMAVHSPDLVLAGFMPMQPPIGPILAAANCAPSGNSSRNGSFAKLQQPLLLLALVASRNGTATPPAAPAKVSSRTGRSAISGQLAAAAAAGGQQQQQHLELRPVLLQQPGLLIPGAPILAAQAAAPAAEAGTSGPFHHARQQQQQQLLGTPGVSAAALAGTLAAAVGPGGFVNVWDVLSGRSLMCCHVQAAALGARRNSSSSRAAAFSAVELLELSSSSSSSSKQEQGSSAAGYVALLGTADGVLTFALV